MEGDGYKIVLIGDSGVGKSSLVYWFIHEKKPSTVFSTVGAAFVSKRLQVFGKHYKFNIWDTAGQERFRSLTRIYYKNTNACICVFDITNRETFNSLQYWIMDYQQHNNNKEYLLLIVANKCDYPNKKWEISENEINDYAKSLGTECIYTSCVSGLNTSYVFYRLGELFPTLGIEFIDQSNTKNNIIKLDSTFDKMKKMDCNC